MLIPSMVCRSTPGTRTAPKGLRRRLRAAYPEGPAGVLLPFRRVFAVAQRVG
ncbi:MAG TPA: hypothetical protein P5181_13975 [Dermatophilaceae bacterium]|nr:hypothetical protein [Dermatophilaceae bacterium]